MDDLSKDEGMAAPEHPAPASEGQKDAAARSEREAASEAGWFAAVAAADSPDDYVSQKLASAVTNAKNALAGGKDVGVQRLGGGAAAQVLMHEIEWFSEKQKQQLDGQHKDDVRSGRSQMSHDEHREMSHAVSVPSSSEAAKAEAAIVNVFPPVQPCSQPILTQHERSILAPVMEERSLSSFEESSASVNEHSQGWLRLGVRNVPEAEQRGCQTPVAPKSPSDSASSSSTSIDSSTSTSRPGTSPSRPSTNTSERPQLRGLELEALLTDQIAGLLAYNKIESEEAFQLFDQDGDSRLSVEDLFRSCQEFNLDMALNEIDGWISSRASSCHQSDLSYLTLESWKSALRYADGARALKRLGQVSPQSVENFSAGEPVQHIFFDSDQGLPRTNSLGRESITPEQGMRRLKLHETEINSRPSTAEAKLEQRPQVSCKVKDAIVAIPPSMSHITGATGSATHTAERRADQTTTETPADVIMPSNARDASIFTLLLTPPSNPPSTSDSDSTRPSRPGTVSSEIGPKTAQAVSSAPLSAAVVMPAPPHIVTEEHKEMISPEKLTMRMPSAEWSADCRVRSNVSFSSMRSGSNASHTNLEIWKNEVEFCVTSDEIAECLLQYIERGLPLESETVQQRLSARIIGRFCRSRLRGQPYKDRKASVSLLQAALHRRFLDSARFSFVVHRRSISLLQSRVRSASAAACTKLVLDAVRRQQALVRRSMAQRHNWSIIAKTMQLNQAGGFLRCTMLRLVLMRNRQKHVQNAETLQSAVRRRAVETEAQRVRDSCRTLQSVLRRNALFDTREPESSAKVARGMVSWILELAGEELRLRHDPFEKEKLGRLKAQRQVFGQRLTSRSKVMASMSNMMADLGCSMSRYLTSAALKMKPASHTGYGHQRLVPDVNSKDKESKTTWAGGMSYSKLLAMQRKTWPAKETLRRKRQESLGDFQARMRFMHERREWDRQHSTSLDPLTLCTNTRPFLGQGAPMIRQKSNEFTSVRPMHSVNSSKSSEWNWKTERLEKVHDPNKRLPWKQETPKMDMPTFVLPFKARRERSATDIGWSDAKTSGASSGGTGNDCSIKDISIGTSSLSEERLEIRQASRSTTSRRSQHTKEAEEFNLETEARTLFNMIDQDQSGSLTLDELRSFMENLGYGDDEIEDFFLDVDEDCSGEVRWEEFLPAAGKFISAPLAESTHGDESCRSTTAKVKSGETDLIANNEGSRLVTTMGTHEHGNSVYMRKGRPCWGFRIGSRKFHGVRFTEVGKPDAAATSEVREVMQQRFFDVGEAFVFFDIDDVGELTHVRFELGLRRMGLLHSINPEQLWCEINSIHDGKLSKIEAHTFMRHFHWARDEAQAVPYDQDVGNAMLRRAQSCREAIMLRGRAPLPLPPSRVTPPPPPERPRQSEQKRVGRQDSLNWSQRSWTPRPPNTAKNEDARRRPAERPPAGPPFLDGGIRAQVETKRNAAQYKSVDDWKKIRATRQINASAKLTVISSPYTNSEVPGVQSLLPMNNALQRCSLTLYTIMTAAEPKQTGSLSESAQTPDRLLPELPGVEAVGTDGTQASSCDVAASPTQKREGNAFPPELSDFIKREKSEKRTMERMVNSMQSRISRLPFIR